MLESSSQAKLWGLILPGREHSECKGPEVRRSLAYLRNGKVSVMWAQCSRRGRWKDSKSERFRGHNLQGRICHGKGLDFGLIAMEKHWRILNKE